MFRRPPLKQLDGRHVFPAIYISQLRFVEFRLLQVNEKNRVDEPPLEAVFEVQVLVELSAEQVGCRFLVSVQFSLLDAVVKNLVAAGGIFGIAQDFDLPSLVPGNEVNQFFEGFHNGAFLFRGL